MNYKDMKMADIIAWCQANNEVAWLKGFALTKKKNGNLPNFFEIRKEFVDKFMPEIKPVAKAKVPNMYDIIKAL